MASCDFCRSKATHVLVNDCDTIVGYLCNSHAMKIVSTRFKLKEIETEPVITGVCSLCNEEKPLSEFYFYTDSKGVRRRRSECKECNLIERKKRRLKKK